MPRHVLARVALVILREVRVVRLRCGPLLRDERLPVRDRDARGTVPVVERLGVQLHLLERLRLVRDDPVHVSQLIEVLVPADPAHVPFVVVPVVVQSQHDL